MGLVSADLRSFSGSMGPSEPENTEDSLFATDVVEGIFGISEGPIKGLVDGARSYYIGETPLKDSDGHSNFDNFELINYKGNDSGEIIRSRLGGFASSTSIGTELATNTPVVHYCSLTRIDYIDVRVVINQLIKSTEKGTFNNVGKFKVEIKAQSANDWKPVKTHKNGNTPGDSSSSVLDKFYSGEKKKRKKGNPGDRPYFMSVSQPVTTADSAIWFDTNDNYRPTIFEQGKGWHAPQALSWNATKSWWTFTEKTKWGTSRQTKLYIGGKPKKADHYGQGDFWVNTTAAKAYYFNGSRWVGAGSTLEPGGFGENGTGGDLSINDGEVKIKAKTTSPFPKEFRIPVERIDEPYMIRVTKTSPINTTERFFDITLESVQEVTAKPFQFPGLAVTQIVARASDQFSSIPDFSGIYDGRIVRVPTNYNPNTRVYNGVWDGTWKLDWTNNPALIANDLVLNDVYGMNRYYPIRINKMDVYEAAQWCDTRRADGKPRFTFNALLTDPRGGRDLINYVCGIFGGRFFDDGNGTGVIKIDKDEDPVALFTPENVADGAFVYSFTELSARHNDISVSFINPELNWQEDRRRVVDQDDIDNRGSVPRDFIAVGCTNVEEAIARGRYQLATGLREKMMVNFRTNRLGQYLGPYNVISIADEDMAMGLSGRLKEITGPRSFSLRDALYLEAGYNYRASFQIVNEAGKFEVVYVPLTPGLSGPLTALTFTEDLPELPELANFSIEQINGSAAPRAFRVMSITPVDGEPDNIEIQAIEMYRAKWLFVDGLVEDLGAADAYLLEINKKPEPIADLRIQAFQSGTRKKPVVSLKLDWDASPSKFIKRYEIWGSRDGDQIRKLGETKTLEFDLNDVDTGEWYFEVTAVSPSDKISAPTSIDFRLIGDFSDIDEVTGLTLVGEKAETIFERRSPRFDWDNSGDADFEEFVGRIRVGGTVVRNFTTKKSEYTYRYQDNKTDNGGTPARSFTIEIAQRDRFGWTSEYTTLDVSNPAPAVPGFSVTQRGTTAQINVDDLDEGDYAGVRVWMSLNENFTPGPANLVHDGKGRHPIIDVKRGKTYYVIIAAYDTFGTFGLNRSGQLMTKAGKTVTDGQIPAEPTGLVITNNVAEKDNQGHWRTKLVYDWADNTDDITDHYEIDIEEEGEKDNILKRPGSRLTLRTKPKSVVRIRVRACDGVGNKSEWTNWVQVTAAKKTTKPSKPTGVVKKNGNRRSRHKWAKSPDNDHRRTAVWVRSSNTPPNPETDPPTEYTGGTTYDVDVDPGEEKYVFFAHQDTSDEFSDVVDGDGTVVSVPLTEDDIDLDPLRNEIAEQIAATVAQVDADVAAMQATYDAAIAAINAEVASVNAAIDDLMAGGDGSDLLGELTDRLRDLTEEVRKAATHSMFEGALGYTERKEIIATANEDRAAFTEEINVLVAADAALAQRTTTLEAETDDLSAGLETIETAMTTADSALASQITTLNSTVAGKANSSAVTALDTRTTAAEGTISTHTGQITSLNSTIAGKADASALTALTTRVTNTENTNTSQATAITNLQTDVAGKASASALSTLSATVTQIDGNVDSVADALTSLFAGDVTGNTASVRVRMQAQAGVGGYDARYGIQVRAGSANSFANAGLYMDVTAGGSSRVAIEADKFMIMTASGAMVPFSVSGNTVTMSNIQVAAANITGTLTASQINATGMNLSNATIGTLTVGTVNLASNSVTNEYDNATAASISLSANSETIIQTVSSVNLTNAYKVLVYVEFMNNDGSFGRNFDIKVYDGGTMVIDRVLINTNDQGTINAMTAITPLSGGSHSFTLRVSCPSATSVKARRLIIIPFYR